MAEGEKAVMVTEPSADDITPFGRRLPFVVGVGSPVAVLGQEAAVEVLDTIKENELRHVHAARDLGYAGLLRYCRI